MLLAVLGPRLLLLQPKHKLPLLPRHGLHRQPAESVEAGWREGEGVSCSSLDGCPSWNVSPSEACLCARQPSAARVSRQLCAGACMGAACQPAWQGKQSAAKALARPANRHTSPAVLQERHVCEGAAAAAVPLQLVQRYLAGQAPFLEERQKERVRPGRELRGPAGRGRAAEGARRAVRAGGQAHLPVEPPHAGPCATAAMETSENKSAGRSTHIWRTGRGATQRGWGCTQRVAVDGGRLVPPGVK